MMIGELKVTMAKAQVELAMLKVAGAQLAMLKMHRAQLAMLEMDRAQMGQKVAEKRQSCTILVGINKVQGYFYMGFDNIKRDYIQVHFCSHGIKKETGIDSI